MTSSCHNSTSALRQLTALQPLSAFLGSPAAVAAVLLYGILFGFAAVSYIPAPWPRFLTISFYLAVLVWGTIVFYARWRSQWKLKVNRLDVLVGTFLTLILISAGLHWWHGTVQYLTLVPVLFVFPYLLGRLVDEQDVLIFQNMLLAMGGILLFLMPMEYVKHDLPYANWPNPYLFAQGHGVMLSGLLFAATFLVLVSRLLLLGTNSKLPREIGRARARLSLYLVFGLVILSIAWMSARGSAIAAVLGMGAIFFFSSYSSAGQKLRIVFAFLFFVVLAILNPFKNEHTAYFYELLVQPPPLVLHSEGSGSPSSRDGDDMRWQPILGEKACQVIKNSVIDRWVHLQTAWAIFEQYPAAGVGANRYGHYSCAGPGWFPHSTILQVLSELGIVGGLVYGALMLAAVGVALKYYYRSDSLLRRSVAGWLFAYLVFQLATSQLYGNYFMSAPLYFVLGVVARLIDDERAESRA